MGIILAILIFGLIVLIHELGHFLLAKANGIKVEEFSIGMGPRLISTVRGGTRYSLKLLPLGGSCMMLGEDSGNTEEGSFNSKPVWSRISVIAAGPIFNFILAFILATIIIGVIGYDPAEVLTVQEGSNAEEAGLQEGDIITGINGKSVDISRELSFVLNYEDLQKSDISLTVNRDGQKLKISYPAETTKKYMLGFSYSQQVTEDPAEILSIVEDGALDTAGLEAGDIITNINGVDITNQADLIQYFSENPLSGDDVTLTYERNMVTYTITVTPQYTEQISTGFNYNSGRVKTSALGVIKYSLIEVKYWISTTFKSLSMLVTGQLGVNDLSGPVGVVNVIGETYEQSKSDGALYVVLNMLNLSILLSANLGVMNLIPIPALDGGRLVFLIIEAVRRKPVNPEKEGMVHFIGFVLLMILMVVVLFNDVRKLL